MEEKENSYISMNEAKAAIILDVRDLNFCYYNTMTFIGVIFSLACRILVYLSICSGILMIAYYIKPELLKSGEFSIYLFPIILGILSLLLVWNKTYKNYLNKKLEEDKVKVAVTYFSKTKEFTQEEWIRNKIFENEIMPLIS